MNRQTSFSNPFVEIASQKEDAERMCSRNPFLVTANAISYVRRQAPFNIEAQNIIEAAQARVENN